MIRLHDDLGRLVHLARPPRRVASLVPSDTFNVARLGAADRLVARTDYCVAPPDLAACVPALGGTKNPRVDELIALGPDLVLANQEENSRGDVEKLERAGVKVFVAFPRTFAEGVAHLARLARLLGVEATDEARALVRQGYAAVTEGEACKAAGRPLRVFLPIWADPLMTIHGDTFISDMLAIVGAENVFADRERRYPLVADLGRASPLPPGKTAGRDVRYPRVTLDEVIARAPEAVLLPDEPHPFGEADADVFRQADLPAARSGAIAFCHGDDLCWPGARAIDGLGRLRALVDDLKVRARGGTDA